MCNNWLTTFVIAILALVSYVALPTKADDFALDVLEDLETSLGAEWWDQQWQYRLPMTISDPALTLHKGKAVWLAAPDPILLANTGRLNHDQSDLRAVDLRGKLLPCGVTNFGLDDGSCAIWVQIPSDQKKPGVKFYLYYGNKNAKPDKSSKPLFRDYDEPTLTPTLGPEHSQTSHPDQQAERSPIFDQLIVAEAEHFLRPDGEVAAANIRSEKPYLGVADRPAGASGGKYVAPTTLWHRGEMAEPRVMTHDVTLPKAGKYRVLVRYRVQEYYPVTHLSMGGEPVQYFHPFKLSVNKQEWTAGTKQQKGAQYRWDEFEADLPDGKHIIKVVIDKLACIDVVVLTQNKEWIPDARDLTGPIWLRVKLVDDNPAPTIANVFCVHTPWSSHGPQGDTKAFLLAEEAVLDLPDGRKRFSEGKETLKLNEWSPWAKTMNSRYPLWWTTVWFIERFYADVRPILFKHRRVAFEVATRPSPDRVIRRNVENVSDHGLMLLMASDLDIHTIKKNVRSFAQWSEERYETAVAMGLKHGEGPKRIPLTTMFEVWSEDELDATLDTLGRIGFNTFTTRTEEDAFVRVLKKHNLPFRTVTHHWYPKVKLDQYLSKSDPSSTYRDSVRQVIKEVAIETYDPAKNRHRPWERRQAYVIVMGDEIGPFTNGEYINALPVLKGFFHEYLKEQGLTPDFFGKKNWDEVAALDYTKLGKIGRGKMRSINPEYETQAEKASRERDESMLDKAVTTGAKATTTDSWNLEAAENEERKAEAGLVVADAAHSTRYDKRLYHWTQKFKGEYTGMVLGEGTRQIKVASKEGKLAHQPLASPNFQAFPAMRGHQWNGALNIFDLARNKDLAFLEIEDWTWCPYRVAFGSLIFKAACRKHKQPFGVLTVGGAPLQRSTANLAIGAEAFISYLYGPRRVIGPPWADHVPTQRQYAKFARWLARIEDDLPKTELRPADAAILMANTTEMNRAFYEHTPRERQTIFVTLADARYPVEVVSEEEVIEDDILSRFKVLYVGDSHVLSTAQEKIRQWVKDGGILWASYDALARQEYDETTDRFNEVFGLKSRGEVLPDPGKQTPERTYTATLTACDLWPAQTIDQIARKPKWQVAGGKVLGTFEDGAPAAVYNKYGKGQAVLVGFIAKQLCGHYHHTTEELPHQAARRKVATGVLKLAGIEKPYETDAKRTFMFVRDGEHMSMLFVIRTLDAPARDISILVKLPKKPVRATTGLGEPLSLEVVSSNGDESQVRIVVPMQRRGAEMIVFDY